MHRRLRNSCIRSLVLLLMVCDLTFASEYTSRSFQLAATTVQLVPLSEEAYRNGTSEFPVHSIAPKVDLITIWPEYLGIPYDIFATGPTISELHPWAVKMQDLAEEAKLSGRPILLELAFVRTGMVGRAWDNNGTLSVENSWAPVCYDFSQPEAVAIGDAYVNYVQWMVSCFQPAYLVNFIEANLYYMDCGGGGSSWEALVEIQQRAYDTVKETYPNLPVLPSFHLETLYNYQLDGWDENQYQAIQKMHHDLFGLSSYPFGMRHENGHFVTPYDLPSDYIVRVQIQHPSEQLAITETGWNSVSIFIGDESLCYQGFPYSEERFAADYLDFVFASAHYGSFNFVNWWSFRDEMPESVLGTCYIRDNSPFEFCNGDPWCMVINYMKDVTYQQNSELFSELVLKAFGAMGLESNDGEPKPLLMNRWLDEFALPLEYVNDL